MSFGTTLGFYWALLCLGPWTCQGPVWPTESSSWGCGFTLNCSILGLCLMFAVLYSFWWTVPLRLPRVAWLCAHSLWGWGWAPPRTIKEWYCWLPPVCVVWNSTQVCSVVNLRPFLICSVYLWKFQSCSASDVSLQASLLSLFSLIYVLWQLFAV